MEMEELKNSTKILEAFKSQDKKFELVIDLSKEISELQNQKRLNSEEITNIYAVVMKNISSTKKKIEFESGKFTIDDRYSYNTDEKNKKVEELFLNNEGISYHCYYTAWGGSSGRSEYLHKNRSQAEFFRALKKIKENLLQEVLDNLKENKAKIVRDFLEKIELVNMDNAFEKENKLKLKAIEYGEINLEVLKMTSTEPSNIKLQDENKDRYSTPSISVAYPSLKDKIIIEQIFEEVKLYLEEYKQLEEKKLENIKLFLEDIRGKFAPYLMLLELKKENKTK